MNAKIRPIDSPFCGCMEDDVVKDFRAMLNIMNSKENGYCWYEDLMAELKLDEKYIYVLLQIATNADLIEHGSAIRGSWLTDAGKQYLTQPVEYTEEWDLWSREAYAVEPEDTK